MKSTMSTCESLPQETVRHCMVSHTAIAGCLVLLLCLQCCPHSTSKILHGMPVVSLQHLLVIVCICRLHFVCLCVSKSLLKRLFIEMIHIIRTKFLSNLQCALNSCWLKDDLPLTVIPNMIFIFLLKSLRDMS